MVVERGSCKAKEGALFSTTRKGPRMVSDAYGSLRIRKRVSETL